MDFHPSASPGSTASDDSPQRRRLPPDERRANLFDAAMAVFAELGYDRATLSDVVDRIGVSKGCLYHHFESKEQLFLALLRDRVDAVVRDDEKVLAAEAAGCRDELLRTLVERHWAHLQEPGQVELASLAMTELPKISAAGRNVFDEVVARKRAVLQTVLERDHPSGAEAPSVEPELAATLIPWMILGVALGQRACQAFEGPSPSADQVGRALAGIILRGVGGPQGSSPAGPGTEGS